MTVQFGSDPANIEKLTGRGAQGSRAAEDAGTVSAEDVARVQELERRDLETATRQNWYWIGSLQTVHMLGWDPARHHAPRGTHPEALAGSAPRHLQEVLPDRSTHGGDAEARNGTIAASGIRRSGDLVIWRSGSGSQVQITRSLRSSDHRISRGILRRFMAPQYVFTMKGLGKTHPPDTVVLKDIWLSFLPGAKIGVLGANGAGKSTRPEDHGGRRTRTSPAKRLPAKA